MNDQLSRFSALFYAAAAYNLGWGLTTVLGSREIPWQVVGAFVLVYAPGYWWTARRPSQHVDLIVIATLGKALGAIGFVWAVATGRLPIAFGLTIMTNDLVWLPGFILYLRASARLRGGLAALLTGE